MRAHERDLRLRRPSTRTEYPASVVIAAAVLNRWEQEHPDRGVLLSPHGRAVAREFEAAEMVVKRGS